jgi:hypothetical protein
MRTKNIIAPIVVAIVAGLFGLFQGWFSHQPEESSRETNQTTHGPQSPVTNNTQGDATHGPQSPIIKGNRGDVIINSLPPALIDRWERILNEQGVSKEAAKARLRELGTELTDFRSDLANRPANDEVSKQTLQQLSKGSFSDAEAALIKDLDRHIESRDFQTASVRAEDLRHLNELQLAPSQAVFYANLADNLRRKGDNTPSDKTDQVVREPARQQFPSSDVRTNPPRDPETGEPLEWGGRGPLDWHRRKQ